VQGQQARGIHRRVTARPGGWTQSRVIAIISLTVSALMVAMAIANIGPAGADTTMGDLEFAQLMKRNCQIQLQAATTNAERTRAQQCITIQDKVIARLQPTMSPSTTTSTIPTTSTTSTTTSSTSPPVPTTTSTAPPTTTSPPSGQTCPAFPAMPDAACTGVPAGVTLTTYTGPCTITTANTVIDSKVVNCTLVPAAAGIVIKNSRVNGGVYGNSGCSSAATCTRPRFTVVDSELIVGQVQAGQTEINGLGESNFNALRVEVVGGNRGVYCRFNCTIEDSWVHGTNIASNSDAHASAIRQSQGNIIRHNRLHCSANDNSAGGGCSADLTGYGDFEAVTNNLVEKNLFVATPGGTCAYGGSSGDNGVKPFGDQAHDIMFIDNIFERGTNSQGGQRLCGFFFPATDFLRSNGATPPGNVWLRNRYEDGVTIAAPS
jgi:hypothetical protein